MKWFKHYTAAHDNNKLTKVRMKFGADGYAVYWYCLELVAGDLGASEEITFELKHDAEVVAFNLRIDTLRAEEIMRYMVDIGLFESSHGTVTCLKLAKYLDKKTTRNSWLHKVIDAANGVPDSPSLSTLDRDIEIDKEKELPKGSSKKKAVAFSPPSILQIQGYIQEKGYRYVSAERFFHFYESKNWMVGKNKMQKWRSAVSNWELKNKPSGDQNETRSQSNKPESNLARLNRTCMAAIREK